MTEIASPSDTKLAKYPDGVFVMFVLQLLTMVGFTMVLSLLVLYATRRLGMPDTKAYTLFAAYNALIFATSVFGGYLGERYLGYRYAVRISIALGTLGLLIIMIHNVMALYWGLACFIIATGIMVPCMFVLLGRLYQQENDPRRDSGFTIAYIGMNVGSFGASLVSGYVANYLGYRIAFLIGAVFTAVTLILFLIYQNDFRRKGAVVRDEIKKTRLVKSKSSKATGIFLILISLPLTAALLNFANLSNILMLVLGGFCVFLVLYLSTQETANYRNKMFAFLILTIISVSFWALYTIAPSVLTIFISRNVDRHVFSHIIPAATYTALNPFFIITIGPLLTMYWMRINQKGKRVATPTKFAFGVLLMGLGYLVLIPAIAMHGKGGYISSWWIVLSYFLQTFGELFVGPIGFAMVGELVPLRLEGLMMGIWQLATGVAGALSEFMAKMTTTPGVKESITQTNPIYSHAFATFGLITVAVGIIAFILSPYLKRISQNSEPRAVRGH